MCPINKKKNQFSSVSNRNRTFIVLFEKVIVTIQTESVKSRFLCCCTCLEPSGCLLEKSFTIIFEYSVPSYILSYIYWSFFSNLLPYNILHCFVSLICKFDSMCSIAKIIS